MNNQMKKVLTIYISNPPNSSSWTKGDPYAEDRLFAKRLDLMTGTFSSIPKENEMFSPDGDGGRKFMICTRTDLAPPRRI
jgi:hypothetical protein